MKDPQWFSLAACFLATLLSTGFGETTSADDFVESIQALEWRCVGPFVGNRGCGVEMHPTDRNVFYHAPSSGGVWKTEDAGQYWVPITEGQINVGSVGAIAVSHSEPEVVYI